MRTVRLACLICAVLGAGLLLPSHARAESKAELEARRAAHDQLLCRKYGGLEEGTDEFAQCVATMAQRRADAAAARKEQRRQVSSQSRALSSAEGSACSTRSRIVNAGGGGGAMAHESGVGTCGQ
jgi:hypothetical protein